eukprot:2630161-Prymnesium_polylepis.1
MCTGVRVADTWSRRPALGSWRSEVSSQKSPRSAVCRVSGRRTSRPSGSGFVEPRRWRAPGLSILYETRFRKAVRARAAAAE